MNRVAVALLGAALLAGSFLGTAQPGFASVRHQGMQLWLSRSARAGGCCDLELIKFSRDAATVEDNQTGFGATASHFLLVRSRLRGYLLLWVYVVERNEQNAAETLVSGPSNWLLIGSDGIGRGAYPGMPHHQPGVALMHVDALSADTDPANEGWIWFRIPLRTPAHYTLAWDDCRPRCNPAAGRSSFASVVDILIGPVPRRRK